MVLAVLSPDNSTNLFPLVKEPISVIERDKALPPTETVSYACKGLSLSCMFPIALGHGDYLFQRRYEGTTL